MRHASPKLVGHGRTRNCAISRAPIPFFCRNVSNTRASPRKRPSLGEPPLQAVIKSAGQRRGATPRRPQAASRRPQGAARRAPVDTHREKTGTPGTRFAHEGLRRRIFGLKSAVRLRKRQACTQRGRRTTPAHSVPPQQRRRARQTAVSARSPRQRVRRPRRSKLRAGRVRRPSTLQARTASHRQRAKTTPTREVRPLGPAGQRQRARQAAAGAHHSSYLPNGFKSASLDALVAGDIAGARTRFAATARRTLKTRIRHDKNPACQSDAEDEGKSEGKRIIEFSASADPAPAHSS